MLRIKLEKSEIDIVQSILDRAADTLVQTTTLSTPSQILNLSMELPIRLQETLLRFGLQRGSPVLVISGFPVDSAEIGPTPAHWRAVAKDATQRKYQYLLVLCSSFLGDVFGWPTQQNGSMVTDILPIAGHENEQFGSGSEETLWWHTEDAFHPNRAAFLGLFCLRNENGVATTICDSDKLAWNRLAVDLLFQEKARIQPDESHLKGLVDGSNMLGSDGRSGSKARSAARFQAKLQRWSSGPAQVSTLFGDTSRPNICLDPFYTNYEQMSGEYLSAFENLVYEVDSHMHDLVLNSGDCCFIDNDRTVHGRKAFTANFDGRDRWVKKVNIGRRMYTKGD